MNQKKIIKQIHESEIANADEIDAEHYPVLRNLSSAFIYSLLPIPESKKHPEFIYIKELSKKDRWMELSNFIAQWNNAWEPAHLRLDMFYDEVPEELNWLKEYEDDNIYLLPHHKNSNYYAFQHLLNLLPAKTRNHHGLPLFKRGTWPSELDKWYLSNILPKDFDERLSKAFAFHIWPLLNKGSKMTAFSKNDPLVLLSHNLNYWLPYLHQLIELKLSELPRLEFENNDQKIKSKDAQRKMPTGITVTRPRMGGMVWYGELEAWDFTKQLVEVADRQGNLQSIIEAVKSNRIKDDFSEKWSYAKEDFERKVYHKRNKTKVTFVELDNTLPVHAPSSEIHENIIWEDFISFLDRKERSIVVCLKKGITELTKISETLGYANHSPVSKAMTKIRNKAKQFLEIK